MRSVVIVAAALLLLTGCSPDEAPLAAPTPETLQPTPSATTATSDAPSASVTSSPSGGFQVERVSGDQAFLSPSGNIRCAVTDHWAGCDLELRAWKLPPAPKHCQGNDDAGDIGEGEWTMPILVGITGTGTFYCGTDVPLDFYDSPRQLVYGHSIRNSAFDCLSEPSGMTCRSTDTGHGFTVSRGAYRVF